MAALRLERGPIVNADLEGAAAGAAGAAGTTSAEAAAGRAGAGFVFLILGRALALLGEIGAASRARAGVPVVVSGVDFRYPPSQCPASR